MVYGIDVSVCPSVRVFAPLLVSFWKSSALAVHEIIWKGWNAIHGISPEKAQYNFKIRIFKEFCYPEVYYPKLG